MQWGWIWIFFTLVMACVAADIWPRRDTRQPSFKILSIQERRVDLIHESDGQIMKVYAVDVAADNGVWKLVIDRENKTVMQRFLPTGARGQNERQQ